MYIIIMKLICTSYDFRAHINAIFSGRRTIDTQLEEGDKKIEEGKGMDKVYC